MIEQTTVTLVPGDRVRLTLARETRRGTVLGLTRDGTRAAVEWDDGGAYFHTAGLLTRVEAAPRPGGHP